MMRIRHAWIFLGLLACTKVGSNQEPAPEPEPTVVTAQARMPAPPPPAPAPAPPTPPTPTPTPPTPPTPPRTVPKVTVQMTAATIADDCGASAPPAAPRAEPTAEMKSKQKSATSAKADRGCDQSSMQLFVKTPSGGGVTQLTVKKVELFDDQGVKIGALTARSPTIWTNDGNYQTWNQKLTPGQELSVSYALSQPAWGSVADKRNRTYVLKAVVTVGGGDQVVKHDVHIAAPTALPAGVKT